MHRRLARRRLATWTLAAATSVVLATVSTATGCKRGGDEAEAGSASASDSAGVSDSAGAEAGASVEPGPEDGAARYQRSLEAQLDLVPPDADGFLVIRDLRPLIAQARVVEALMTGPLRRAIPALARLGGGTGAKRLEQLERTQELLDLILTGLEGAGIELEAGAVVALSELGPTVVFSASDLDRLTALAAIVGGADLGQACRPLAEPQQWFACSLGGPEALARYAPAGQGAALAKRLRERVGVGAEELDAVNVALSLATGDEPIDAVLRTDPGLWELSVPLAAAGGGAALVRAGAPTALRALVPGTSFAWARLDPELLGVGATGLDSIDASLLSGELFLGVSDAPDGIVALVGTTDEAEAVAGVEAMTKLLPESALEPAELPGVSLSFDRARLEIGGRPLPSIGVAATGEAATGWAKSLGIEPRARLWAAGDYLAVALGSSQTIPAALAAKSGPGPSADALAALPPSLAAALVAGEVGIVVHLVLDHWQAPPSPEELDALLAGLGPEARPAATSIFAAFDVLAPWSTLDLWARRVGPEAPWSLRVSLVPFAAPTAGVGAEEQAAIELALANALANGNGQQVYRELATRFPDSVHAARYRARTGDAPAHHAAMGMIELGLIGALVVPALDQGDASPRSEAPALTQSILAAALEARAEAGRCKPLVGKAGPTPPLAHSCLSAPDGQCLPSEDLDAPDGEGRYPLTAWTDDPLWGAIAYAPRPGVGHRAHYSIEIAAQGKNCEISVLAEVELEPGKYATYRRAATVERDGATTLIPLEIGTRGD